MRRRLALAALLLLPLLAASPVRARVIRVAYAGSMSVVMDRALGPQFAAAHHAHYQGIGQGAFALAHLLAAKRLRADVFVSITPGPIRLLQKAGLVARGVPIASTRMVIAYSPKSRFAPALAAAAAGRQPWAAVLQSKGLRFGRTDPRTDPQGQNILFTLRLAERYLHQPGLAARIAGPTQNPRQIFTETSLLSRLESGQIDAASGYASATLSHHLPFIPLPDEINLSNPAMQQSWYATVRLTVHGADGKARIVHPAPLVFYAAVLKNAPAPDLAAAFVAFLASPHGQAVLRAHGYDAPKGGPL